MRRHKDEISQDEDIRDEVPRDEFAGDDQGRDESEPDVFKREKKKRRKRIWRRRLLLLLLIAAAGAGAYLYMHRGYYSAAQLGLTDIKSSRDEDQDGVDDYSDFVKGARAYIRTNPHYESNYYEGGYPDDGCGVCTDVIWHAFEAAGYDLKSMVDKDVAGHLDAYKSIRKPDPNIDFRRVKIQDTFFKRKAESLPLSFDDPEAWQPGDIVVFGDGTHIAICSDKRDAAGIPWIIHHGNPEDEAVERPEIYKQPVTGHYRWKG